MISIIIATYNAQATLERSFDSLRAQKDADFEVLVADGGSTDHTLARLEPYRDLIAVLEQGPDQGIYDAWNKVIGRARGQWLMFLGADDWLQDPHTLARLAQHAATIPAEQRALSYVYGQTEVIEAGRTIERLGTQPLPDNRLDPDSDIPFGHTGLLHHRSLFAHFGLFSEVFRSAGDYEFLLRTAPHPQVRFFHVPMTVAHMASGGTSSGARSRFRHYREMLAVRQGLGLARTPLWLYLALARSALLRFLHAFLGAKAALMAANAYRRLMGKVAREQIA